MYEKYEVNLSTSILSSILPHFLDTLSRPKRKTTVSRLNGKFLREKNEATPERQREWKFPLDFETNPHQP
jgi:hypothetical protein